jgi:hypothetical protein
MHKNTICLWYPSDAREAPAHLTLRAFPGASALR